VTDERLEGYASGNGGGEGLREVQEGAEDTRATDFRDRITLKWREEMRQNYTVTFSADHDILNLLELCGIKEEDNPMDVAFKIHEALEAEEWEEGTDASSSHILFDILPKIVDKPEAYMLYFMITGYQRWVATVNAAYLGVKKEEGPSEAEGAIE
jgi:hypothetical protein